MAASISELLRNRLRINKRKRFSKVTCYSSYTKKGVIMADQFIKQKLAFYVTLLQMLVKNS